MKKKPKVWLARNGVGSDWRTVCYVLALGVKPRYEKETETWYAFRRGEKVHKVIGPFEFEAITPESIHLDYGEGPIEIDVKISRVK